MAVYLDEEMIGLNADEIGFPNLRSCMGLAVTYKYESWGVLAGIHLSAVMGDKGSDLKADRAVAVFAAELKKYPNVTEIVWCQDEPQNQGAWFFIQHNIHENMQDGQKLGYAGRAASASPAVGYSHLHAEQQKALVDAAFGKLKGFILTK